MTVTLVDPEGYITYHASTTNASGQYQIPNVPAGRYYAFTTNELGLTNEIFDNLLCRGGCAPSGAGFGRAVPASPMCYACLFGTPIIVTAGATASGKDFGLDIGGSIAGRVTAADTGSPVAGVTVTASFINPDGGSWSVAYVRTDADGEYLVRSLPAGPYYLNTTGAPSGYLNEIYDNVHCGGYWGCSIIEGGTPIDVALGVTSGDTDIALDRGGRIAGVVRDASTLDPVSNAWVNVYWRDPTTGQVVFAAGDSADATGAYVVQRLASGNHYVVAGSSSTGHVTTLYDGVSCVDWSSCDFASGTAVPVTISDTTAGVDLDLAIGGDVGGAVRDESTSAGLSSVRVTVFRRVGDTRIESVFTTTSTSGAYEVHQLPPGTYYAYTTLWSGYGNEIYDNMPCPSDTGCEPLLLTTGTPITVTGGAVTSGVDFEVAQLSGPPAAPRGLRAYVDNGLVRLAWEPPLFGPTFADYVLEAGLSPGATAVTSATNSPPYDVAGVTPGRYYVRVRARNSFGAGPPTDDLEVVVPVYGPTAPLDPPTRPFAWMSGRRLTLTWAGRAAGATLTGYLVEAGTAAGLANIGSAPVTGRFLTFEPVPDGFYFLRVRAVRGSDLGAPSPETMLNVGNVPAPPGAPTALAFTIDGATVNLTWTAPAAGAPTSYVLEAGSEPGRADLVRQDTGSTATNVAHPGVPPGRYYVRVRAVNSLGAGVVSDEVVVTVP